MGPGRKKTGVRFWEFYREKHVGDWRINPISFLQSMEKKEKMSGSSPPKKVLKRSAIYKVLNMIIIFSLGKNKLNSMKSLM